MRGIERPLDVVRLGAGNLTNHLARGRRYIVKVATLDGRDPRMGASSQSSMHPVSGRKAAAKRRCTPLRW
jgi:hypothetical protein